MKRSFLLTILIIGSVLFGDRAFAQFLTISEVDTSEFPKLWVSFTARDANGEPMLNLKPSDFTIWENGVVVPDSKKEITCDYPPANIVLCIDQSSSMSDEINGINKWSWVKAGVQEFVRNMQLSDVSKVSLISFGYKVYLRCPWTKVKTDITDSLEKIQLYGATDFNQPFLAPDGAIAQFKKVDPKYRRIIIFLSDGDHDYSTYPVILRDSIINSLRNQNIQVYAIQLVNPMNNTISDVAQLTGGRSYVVNSASELNEKYVEIANDAKAQYMCYLKWSTDYICLENDAIRNVKFHFSKLAQFEENRNYRIPWSGRAILEPFDTTFIFDDPEPGQSVDRIVKITARNTSQTIRKISISPSQYFQIVDWSGPGTPGNTNITVDKDQTYYVTVRFTQQGSKGLRQATLQIDADPCDLDIPLKGGYPQIVITNPKKGDVFNDCEELDIRWDNVGADVGVNLDYSTDMGANWTRFATDVKGLSYKWRPGFTTNNMRLRAEVGDNPMLRFLKTYGSAKDEYPTGLAINKNGSYAYVSGNFNESLKLGNVDLKNYGGRDMFLMKVNTDGDVLWATSTGSSLADSSAGLVVDAEGNIFTLGVCYKNTYLDSYLANQTAVDGKSSILLTKYTPAGGVAGVVNICAGGAYTDFQVRNLKLGYRQSSYTEPIIYVEGEYSGSLKLTAYIGFDNPDATSWHPFTMVLNRDLLIDSIYSVFDGKSYAHYDYSKMSAEDRDYNKYEIGSFEGQTQVLGRDVISKGLKDIYLAKNGLHPKSVFETEDFTIDHPVISFATPNMQLGDCLLGDTCLLTLPLKLKNTSKAVTRITKIELPQNDYNAFIIDSAMIGTVIPPLDSVTFTIKFNPTRSGYLNGQLRVGAECASDILVNLKAQGRCEIEVQSLVDVGKVFLSDSDGVHVDCLIKNNNKMPVSVRIMKIGPNPNEFLIAPSTDYAINIEAGECKAFDISFLPKYLGKRTVALQYTFTPSCGNSLTDIVGEAIEDGVHLDLDDVVWTDPRRVKSVNDSIAIIKNKGNVDANITSIRFENTNGDVFVGKLPEVPFILKAKENIEIPIDFVPEREGEARGTIVVEYDDMPQQLRGELTGYGWLPELAPSWDCGEDIKPGAETTAKLYVSNPAKFSALKIDKIDLDVTNGEFSWIGDAPAAVSIPPDTTFVYDIKFAPKNSQIHAAHFKIYSDNYDATFVGDWKENPFVGGCGEVNLAYENPIIAPAAILCGGSETTVEIDNVSSASPLILFADKMTISGQDYGSFDVVGVTGDVVIDPQSAAKLKISFAPQRLGLHQATLNIENSFGIPISISLSGDAEKIPLSAEKILYKATPGESNTLSVRARIPDLGADKLDSLAISLVTNDRSIAFIKGSIKSGVPGFNWEEPVYRNNSWRIVGRGSLAVPYDGELFNIHFLTLLDTSRSAKIQGTVDYGCATSGDDLSTVQINEVCFQDGRQIEIPGKPFEMTVTKTLEGNNLEVTYNLALDCIVDLTLYNSMGQEAVKFENGLKALGEHRVVKDLNAIPSGVYWLRIISGPYTKTIRVDIVK